ncbi:phosphatidylserine synthase 2-like isoform X2 [Dysidea avara]|uniref:phosphatidylserine synthase 2-like isoform X2 n=1 Tax=Dysidea avara TaxID=196820 RepID=UPI0033171EF6
MCSVLHYSFIAELGIHCLLTSFYNHRGVIAVIIIFLLIGIIHMPDGPFIRPHPVLWRLVLCISILYVLMLIYILFQTADSARQLLRLYDPSLGVPLEELSYAEDCSIYTPGNPKGTFHNVMIKFDVFVFCHTIGWWAKGIILRDVWLLNIISFLFELMEYTLESQLPNFAECWWDHWIMDFIICNGLGIWLGMLTCKYFSMKEYHWTGLWKIPSLRGKMKRLVGQFTPYKWTSFEWGYTTSFQNFLLVCFLVFLWTLQELNVFYLKTVLWIPPSHTLNFYRELFYGFSAAVAVHEGYTYLKTTDPNDPNCKIGRQSWILMAALAIEVLIVVKFGWETITLPIPYHICVAWAVTFICFSIWVFWHFTFPFKDWPILGPRYRKLFRIKED